MGAPTRTARGVAVVEAEGELDRDALVELDAAIGQATSTARPRLVIDLTGCRRITSDALRRFVSLARQLEGRGGGFALAGASGEVERAISLAGIDRLVTVLPSVKAAVAALDRDRRIELLATFVVELLGRAEARA